MRALKQVIENLFVCVNNNNQQQILPPDITLHVKVTLPELQKSNDEVLQSGACPQAKKSTIITIQSYL
jgi:hypothetical protein